MTFLHPEILEHVRKTGILLTTNEAAKLIRVSRNRFKEYFVETKVIEPIYLEGLRYPRFSLYDVLLIPERMKEKQETSRNSNHSFSITDMALKIAEEGL